MSKIDFPLITRRFGAIDPESIEAYIAAGGYQALERAVIGMSPEAVLQEVERSGLRGRSGGGFPAGRKWRVLREAQGLEKFLIGNGSEGDPGAFTNQTLMEQDPHAIIEGMIIGAYATGASQGYIYVGHEYPLALARLRRAADQARAKGFLGERILDKDFGFDLQVRRGAGAYVCGEETALMNFLEGNIGEPRNRPPYPFQRGLWGRPTIINNVETWANVPVIIEKGADWFTAIGTEGSKGTKVFTLTGDVKNTGTVEVPMGATLRQLVYDLGGGIKGDREFKGLITSGPAGAVFPQELLDLPVDFESFQAAGGNLGSGSLVVMDQHTCMVDVAKYFLSFCHQESCGKCTPCREGTKQMLAILEAITKGEGTEEHLGLLEELAAVMRSASICGLGQGASNPVLSTLKHFRAEYEAHIREKQCPALVCRPLLKYTVDPEKCIGCLACLRECPVGAVSGEFEEPQEIDQELCIKCGMCYAVCKFEAVKVES